MEAWAMIGGALVLAAAGCWWGVSAFFWRRNTHARVRCITAAEPLAIVTSAQVAAVTHRALRRIARADGVATNRTGAYYSIVVTTGCLRLVGGGSESRTIAEFSAARVRDARVGKTSWFYVTYTTLFLGVKAGDTTFELPIRVNGPRETSLFPASEEWIAKRWREMDERLHVRP